MSIQVTCPNGHVLRVKSCFAGKAGLCPACKAKVLVPQPDDDPFSEDEIIHVLGPHDPSQSGIGSTIVSGRSGDRTVAGPSPPKKICSKCNREISAGTHICPFCRTYIASLRDW